MSSSYFSILTADVRYSKEISDGEKILFSEISSLTTKYGYCTARNSYFAKLYNIGEAAISKRINNLARAGFLRCEIDGANGNARKIFLVISHEKGSQPPVETYQPTVETSQPPVETPINPQLRPYQPTVEIENNTSLTIQDRTVNTTDTPLPPADEKPKQSQSKNDVNAIFDFWKTKMEHSAAKMDGKREGVIKKALKWGYSVDELCQAIDGCSKTPFNMGQNNQGQRYDSIQLIFKDADQLDRFMANSLNPPRALSKTQSLEAQNAQALADYEAHRGAMS